LYDVSKNNQGFFAKINQTVCLARFPVLKYQKYQKHWINPVEFHKISQTRQIKKRFGVKTSSHQNVPLLFEGNLTIRRAVEIRDMILNHFKNNDSLMISFGKVDSVDISFLQLLCSMHMLAVKENKTVRLDTPVSDELKKVMRHTGYEGSACCGQIEDTDCVWKTITGAEK